MLENGRHPFEKQSDRELRFGLVFGAVVYFAWLAMSFSFADRQLWFVWLIRAAISMFFVGSWYEGRRELKRRKRNRDS